MKSDNGDDGTGSFTEAGRSLSHGGGDRQSQIAAAIGHEPSSPEKCYLEDKPSTIRRLI